MKAETQDSIVNGERGRVVRMFTLAAWTPPVQPLYHPTDQDQSVGTTHWRAALLQCAIYG